MTEKPTRTAFLSTTLGEKLGVPHTFNPNLTVLQATGAAAVAFSRIFLGSMVFALWGVFAWKTYASIDNPLLRALAIVPIVALFLCSMAVLMIAITAVANRMSRKSA